MTATHKAVDGANLLKIVQMMAIDADDAMAIAANYRQQARAKNPHASEAKVAAIVADKIVNRYARYASLVGGASALAGVVPGIGTAVALTAGATADAGICMKLQVDMVMCIAAAYGYDLNNEDARHLSFLIAAGGTLEKAGVNAGTRLASQAGVRMLRQYLRGATLQAVKQMFKKIGIVFTRKAAEKALPFGIGVAIGSTANYTLTRFVGKQAVKWFDIDAQPPA